MKQILVDEETGTPGLGVVLACPHVIDGLRYSSPTAARTFSSSAFISPVSVSWS